MISWILLLALGSSAQATTDRMIVQTYAAIPPDGDLRPIELYYRAQVEDIFLEIAQTVSSVEFPEIVTKSSTS